jgi:Domain of unknown function (DUF4188)
MAGVISQRMTGKMNGDFVVFLIGMRVNRWWKVHRWLRVAMAMPRMLRELGAKPELGLLGAEAWFGRTTIMVQYWRSLDALLDYAKSRDAVHLPAWREFNKAVGTNGDVGIWHETYRASPGTYESVYVNMPRFGLGKAGEVGPAATRAEERMAASRPGEGAATATG